MQTAKESKKVDPSRDVDLLLLFFFFFSVSDFQNQFFLASLSLNNGFESLHFLGVTKLI